LHTNNILLVQRFTRTPQAHKPSAAPEATGGQGSRLSNFTARVSRGFHNPRNDQSGYDAHPKKAEILPLRLKHIQCQ
jgi:hypothetical protein